MKAVMITRYGSPDVLEVRDLPVPQPKANEIRVRVRAASVGIGDRMIRRFGTMRARDFNMPALMFWMARMSIGWSRPRPRTLGAEFSGVVDAVGTEVTRFRPGDAVFGYPGITMGAHAEYIVIAEDKLVAHKPEGISHEEATGIPYGAITAMSLLRRVTIKPGDRVLVVGASGSIGSAALQLARHAGAVVTGVCGTARMDYVRALGAEHVIDYTRDDPVAGGAQYDLIIDILGRVPFWRGRRALKPGGVQLYVSFKMAQVWRALWTARFGRRKAICALSNDDPRDMETIRNLMAQGVLKSQVDRCFDLEDAADAHRFIEAGENRANVVLIPGMAAR